MAVGHHGVCSYKIDQKSVEYHVLLFFRPILYPIWNFIACCRIYLQNLFLRCILPSAVHDECLHSQNMNRVLNEEMKQRIVYQDNFVI